MASSTPRRRWLAAAAAGLLTLSACGSGTHTTVQQPAASPGSTQAAVTPAPTTVTAPVTGTAAASGDISKAQTDLGQLNSSMTSLDGELSSADQAIANGG